MTIVCVGIAVPLNTVFGVLCALMLVRQRFRGKGLINSVIDLPFAVSPVVIGLSLFLIYGEDGLFGGPNLITVASYNGLDPEVSNFGNQPIARNIDVAPYPPSRSFWFSVTAGF